MEETLALPLPPAGEARRVRLVDVQGLGPAVRRHHDGVGDGRVRVGRRGEERAPDDVTGVGAVRRLPPERRVVSLLSAQHRLEAIRQAGEGRHLIGPQRVAAALGNLDGIEQRVLRRVGEEAPVRVPVPSEGGPLVGVVPGDADIARMARLGVGVGHLAHGAECLHDRAQRSRVQLLLGDEHDVMDDDCAEDLRRGLLRCVEAAPHEVAIGVELDPARREPAPLDHGLTVHDREAAGLPLWAGKSAPVLPPPASSYATTAVISSPRGWDRQRPAREQEWLKATSPARSRKSSRKKTSTGTWPTTRSPVPRLLRRMSSNGTEGTRPCQNLSSPARPSRSRSSRPASPRCKRATCSTSDRRAPSV